MSFKKQVLGNTNNFSLLRLYSLTNLIEYMPNITLLNFSHSSKFYYEFTSRERKNRFLRPYNKESCFLCTSKKYFPIEMVFLNDNVLVVHYFDGIRLWNIDAKKIITKINVPKNATISLAASENRFGFACYWRDISKEHCAIKTYKIKNSMSQPQLVQEIKHSNHINNNPDIYEYNKLKIVICGKYLIVWNYDIRIYNLNNGRFLKRFNHYHQLLNVASKNNTQIAVLHADNSYLSRVDLINLENFSSQEKLKLNDKAFEQIAFYGKIMILATDVSEKTNTARICIYYAFKKVNDIAFSCYSDYDPVKIIVLDAPVIVITSYDSQTVTILDLYSGAMIRQIYIKDPCNNVMACNANDNIAIFSDLGIKVFTPIPNSTSLQQILRNLMSLLQKALTQFNSNIYYTNESYKLLLIRFHELSDTTKLYYNTSKTTTLQELLRPMGKFLLAFLNLKYVANVGQEKNKWEKKVKDHIAKLFNFLNQVSWHILWYAQNSVKNAPYHFYSHLHPNCDQDTFTYKLIRVMSNKYNCKSKAANLCCCKAGLFFSLENYVKVIKFCDEVINNEFNTKAYLYRGIAYYKLKKYDCSIKDLERLCVEQKFMNCLSDHEREEIYYTLGLCYIEKRDFISAIKYLRKAEKFTNNTDRLDIIRKIIQKLKNKLFQKDVNKW